MATVNNNPITAGLSGKFGQSFVFKSLRGKTIVARPAAPTQKQSPQQKANRNKFKEAATFAKEAMKDAAKKEYYWKKAKKLKLPNAYTAAITDYMRSPKLSSHNTESEKMCVFISKKDFSLKRVQVMKLDQIHATHPPREGRRIDNNLWQITFSQEEVVLVEDNVGNTWRFDSRLTLLQ